MSIIFTKSNYKIPSRRLNFRERVQSNFRLVDVESECVRDASLDERYVALSYVCNVPSMFTLRKDNAERLYVEGYLERIRPDLPKTIKDAIDLVKAIGEKYLWVDSLCLISDDEIDIALGIRIMNSVFQGSYFTIIAAAGVDANAGLWGIGPDTEESTARETANVGVGLKVTTDVVNLRKYLSKSEYNKRGWTLQELALSRRTLIFMDDRVFFGCKTADWGETYEPCTSRIPDLPCSILPPLPAYLELFEEYSRRELRYDGDALRGFYGLIRPLFAGMKTSSVEGLPGDYISAFMLFTSPGANLRRRREFASYSWTGWAGELKWPRENLIWYDGHGQRTQSLSNIFRWLNRNEIADWVEIQTAVDDGSTNNLSCGWRLNQGESNLVELLKGYPHLFDSNTVEARRWYRDRRAGDIYSPGASWERIIWVMENPKAGSKTKKPRSCMYAMRSVNSQAESSRFIQRMNWGQPDYMLRSWNAYHVTRKFYHTPSLSSHMKQLISWWKSFADCKQRPVMSG
jgi:hypothetical protein